jgi:hypothetical protein
MAQPIAKVAGRVCMNCGGGVSFKPGSDAVECAHCGHVQGIERAEVTNIVEYDFATARTTAPTGAAAEISSGGREVCCSTCGARAVVTGQATRCPFCDAAVVVEIPESARQILPESVLPFALDQAAAKAAFKTWMRTRWFAPNDLVRRSRTQGLDGVYLPYWTFDSATTTSYTGQRGEHYYETERYTDAQGKSQTRQVRKTRWYSASGTVHVSFDDVLVCASCSLPPSLVDKLEPWDLAELRGFDDRYLAGFTAERYAVDLEDGFQRAEKRMEPRIRTAIERDIGGDDQRIHSMNVRHADVRFKHLLMPLWISAFRYKEKIYRVTVNARTGEVAGERPWSWIKIVLFVVMIVAIVVGIALLYDRATS